MAKVGSKRRVERPWMKLPATGWVDGSLSTLAVVRRAPSVAERLWVKATVPRYRYDQLMRLGWKVFLPISLIWVFLISGYLMLTRYGA